MFRQTQQLPGGGETLDQFHARLLQLSKNCNFANRDGEIRSQIIQKCAMAKIRDKGLSEADITLEQLLRYGRTLESTIQQSLVMSNSAHAMSTTAPSVNAVSSRQQQHYGKTNKGASRDSGNQRRHDDRQGQHHPRHSHSRGGQSTSMNTRQRAPPRHANTVPGHSDARFCPGCGKSPHNRTECSAWGKICFKCDKRNHFANVCRSTAANTNLVVNVEQPLSQTDADLCNDTYALNLYNTNTQHSDSVKPYVCTINVCSTPVILEIDTGSSVTLLSHTEWARIKEKAPELTLDTKNVPCLRTYSGHNIQPLGRTLLDVYHNDTHYQLYALVVPGTGPKWGAIHQKAFEQSKALLSSSKVLAHYDPQLPIIVSSEASAYGIGSVLSHRMPDGSEKPVAFASRSLSPAEKKYAQLEKEALALIFGVTKFHKYLCGRSFTLQSDHRPLLGLLKQDRVISAMASARIQRWALTLSNYEYKLEYMPGSRISHADCMSRLPLPDAPIHVPVPQEVVLALSTLDETPINSDQIEKWTSADPVLSQVRRFVEQGWSDQTPPEFDCYRHRKDELSVQQGVLFWGARVIIPPKGRDALLRELHDTHPGIVKMKALARSYLWWPGLDMEIERHVKDCNTCQIYSRQPPVAPLHPWEWPGRTWHRIHIDYAGPFEGRMLLIIVDAHSKFIDAHIVSSATTSVTLTKLRQTFSFTGLPHTIVSDNGSCFTSDEFEQFCRANGIKHVRCSPYHPSSNGAAERAVQTVKFGLRKTKGNLEDRLYTLLARYRVTPQGTTGRAPAEFMLKTPPQTRFDLLRPSVHDKVLEKQAYDKQRHDTHAAERAFMTGDSAWALNFQGKPKWMPTVIESQLGPLTFTVRLSDGRLWKRHQDHLYLYKLVSHKVQFWDQYYLLYM